jgi:hypothetical protein
MLIVLAAFYLVACKDKDKDNATKAGQVITTLAALAEKDCAEVERGLPEGAKSLATLFAKGADPRQDVAAVRTEIKKVRRDNMDLNVAKSTFFALTDDKGVAIRNDLDTDVMAGQNLITIFPDLSKATTAYTTTTGSFPPSGPRAENDKDWVAAVPVKKDDGALGGLFVTGWSYRYFARHLSEALKSQLIEEAKKTGNPGKIPVYYIAVFDKSGVYTAPLVPDVNMKALADQDLVTKTSGGAFSGNVKIDSLTFGIAAARVAKLGVDTGIVILWSDV